MPVGQGARNNILLGGLGRPSLFDTNIKATSIDEDIFTDQEVISSAEDADLVLVLDVSETPDQIKYMTKTNFIGEGLVAVSNNTNNYVTTATGSALNGEANLTFDGTILTVESGEVNIDISSGDPHLSFQIGNSDTWTIGADDSDSDKFKINSAGSLVDASDLILDSSGNLTLKGGITVGDSVSAINSSGLVQVAGQTSITSLGTLTGLTLDGNKNVTPGDGGMIHLDTSTITDNATSGSGTATKYTHVTFEAPTLAATNSSVTTTSAATLYINAAPSAGTNQTLTNAYALWVDAGTAKLDGDVHVGGDLTVAGDDITMGTNTAGHVLVADDTNFNPVAVSGDVTMASTGAVTIANDAVESGMLNDNVISGQTEISSGLVDADELLYSDGGVLKKVGFDTFKSAVQSGIEGDITGVTLTADDTNTASDTAGSADFTLAGGANITTSVSGTTVTSALDSNVSLTSSSANEPVLTITNTHADATAGFLKFVKDPGSGQGADSDIIGTITFHGTDASNNAAEELARMEAYVIEADHGSEAGGIKFYVAENDATMTAGLQILGVKDADGEIDVTIGAGAASTTTIAGTLTMGSTAAMTNAGLVSVANQSNITGVGTITSGTWNGTAIDGGYINDNIISGQAEITSGLATADELLYSDDGTVKRVGLDTLTTYLAGVNAGTSSSTGLTDSSGVLTIADLHPVGVDGANNQLITDDGDGTVTSEAQLTFDGDVLAITGTGSATSNKDILTITNDGNASSMTATETSILFNQFYYDGSSPAVADAGRISIGTEGNWTSTTSTQDSYLALETALNGTVTENLRITSAGLVGINNTDPGSLLDVRGDAGAPGILTLSTAETTVVDGDKLGRIDFQAPKETGTDAIVVSAAIWAESDVTFDATNNATDIVFATGHSEVAAEKFRFTSQNEIGIAGANYGTDGQVLTSGGAGAAVAWEDASASSAFTSSSANEPVVSITNTHADATAGFLKFVKDPGSGQGADSDILGTITFHGTDASNNAAEELARMEAYVIEADHGSEAGGIKFYVAENDATMTAGLQILGVKDADGEIDVTIGAGAASTTIIAGTLTMGSTAAMTNAGLVSVANQSNITGLGTISSGTWEATDVAVAHGGTGASSLTDNAVLTGTGTSAITAESTLAFTGDTLTASSSSADLPMIELTNTHAGATAGKIRFNKDSGSGDDNDVMGTIEWYGTDAGENTHELLSYIDSYIIDSAHGSEASGLRFYVAENDATKTLGLQILGQADDDGEVDIVLGAGTASTTTVAGDLTISGGDITYGNGQNATASVAATAHNAAGKNLTLSAGTTTAGTTNNIAGGALTLQGGQGKGSGAGGDIIFQTANAGGSGSSLNSLATALTISDDLSSTFADNVFLGSDSAVLNMGADNDVTFTHDGTTGLTIAANPFEVDSGGNITLDAHTGIFIFQDANTEILRITESGSGDVTIKLETNGKDLIFTDNGDAAGLTIKDAQGGIVVPGEVMTTKISYTDGDDAITVADGGGTTFAQDISTTDAKYVKLGGSRMATSEPATDHTGYGIVVGFDSAGSVALGDAVCVNSSGKVAQANAAAGSVTDPAIGIATNAAGSDGDDCYVLIQGIWRDDTHTIDEGKPVYLGESAGGITKTRPSDDGDHVQVLGIGVGDGTVLIMPSLDVIEHA